MTLSAADIKRELDAYVIGQDAAKRTLANAVASHYLSVSYSGPTRIKKANVILLGPTGVGKTYLVETVARILEVPFFQTTATAIVPSGWLGDKIEDTVVRMYQRAKQRWGKDAFRRAKTGIVYIDEIDKLALRPGAPGGPTLGADAKFNTIQVQQSLLRVIEGTEVTVDGNPLDTSGILFVASGAFVGLEVDIQRRVSGGKPFSRGVGPVNPLRDVIPQDLIAYGLIPEFVGRFPVTAALDRLTEGQLVSIMRDAKGGIVEQKRAMLSVIGCDLEISDDILLGIARRALAQGTGARGIQAIVEKRLEPSLYDLEPDTLVRITDAGVEKVGRGVASVGGLATPPPCDGEPTAAAPAQESTS